MNISFSLFLCLLLQEKAGFHFYFCIIWWDDSYWPLSRNKEAFRASLNWIMLDIFSHIGDYLHLMCVPNSIFCSLNINKNFIPQKAFTCIVLRAYEFCRLHNNGSMEKAREYPPFRGTETRAFEAAALCSVLVWHSAALGTYFSHLPFVHCIFLIFWSISLNNFQKGSMEINYLSILHVCNVCFFPLYLFIFTQTVKYKNFRGIVLFSYNTLIHFSYYFVRKLKKKIFKVYTNIL